MMPPSDRPLEELGVGAAERQRLRRALGALTDEDRARVEPPPEVWRKIRVGLSEESEAPASAPVIALGDRRARRSLRMLVGAVAASVAVLAAVGVLLLRDDTTAGAPELVAAAALRPLGSAGESAAADVELVRADDHYELVLEAEGMAPAPVGQHYELWLLDPSAPSAEPVSLGPMTGSTTVDVPAGVDPDRYDVVDVSLQDAGEVEHSGNSLLRGTLA